jgi:hypothetical protein
MNIQIVGLNHTEDFSVVQSVLDVWVGEKDRIIVPGVPYTKLQKFLEKSGHEYTVVKLDHKMKKTGENSFRRTLGIITDSYLVFNEDNNADIEDFITEVRKTNKELLVIPL